MKFSEFGLNDALVEAIDYMNFTEATPIQDAAIPLILNKKDMIGCAQTGTGKTAAFLLPTLHQIASEPKDGISTLILVPTRELAIQIDQQLQGLSYFTNVNGYPVYGGGSGPDWEKERRALSGGADIIIATPGRLISHINNGYVKFGKVRHLILDEADRMLDIGFYDDIIKIIGELPKQRQSLMFSATMAPKIRKLARQILNQPEEVNLSVSKPAEGVTQRVYLAFDNQKMGLVKHILSDKDNFKSIIIFCSRKKTVDQLTRTLKNRNYSVAGMSSDYEQEERQKVMLDFKARNIRIVVATDVLSRGIDIKDIDLVINYDAPNDPEDYVHRVGRTARAATKGLAITLVNEDDMYKLRRVEEFIERDFEKEQPPEHLGPGPEWQTGRRSGGGRGRGRSGGSGGGRQGGGGGNSRNFKGKPRFNKGTSKSGGGGNPQNSQNQGQPNRNKKRRPQGNKNQGGPRNNGGGGQK